jgi:hypothetical protein
MRETTLFVLAAALCAGLPACDLQKGDGAAGTDAGVDSGSDADSGTDTDCHYDGVDLLIMVDNSGSMTEEQALLGEGLYSLVRSMSDPSDGATYAAVDAMRVAVITSDMGVSYGDDAVVPDVSETPPSLQAYLNTGDNGRFQTDTPASVEIDGGSVPCPAIDAPFVETTNDAPNDALATQAACLAQQGTAGCGWEQQLQAASVALRREDQHSFLVDHHVLAVLVVSDEEDCSMADAPGLLATEQCQDATQLSVACNAYGNDQFLFDAGHYYDAYVAAKGTPDAVVFAAIAGVPYGDAPGADACQGKGDAIGDCLDQDAMQMTVYIDVEVGTSISKFEPACERYDGDTLVTNAVPGRRFVSLASDYFGPRGYVSSICNDDWTPAMEEIAKLIGERIEEACE